MVGRKSMTRWGVPRGSKAKERAVPGPCDGEHTAVKRRSAPACDRRSRSAAPLPRVTSSAHHRRGRPCTGDRIRPSVPDGARDGGWRGSHSYQPIALPLDDAIALARAPDDAGPAEDGNVAVVVFNQAC